VKHQIRTAVLVAAILGAILLSSTCFAQGDRPVKVDTSAQGGNAQPNGQGNIGGLTPAPKAPEVAKPPVQPVAKSAASAPVQRVRSARPQVIQNTRTIIREDRGHRAVDQEIKRWNPASRTYVDARDQRVLRQADARADKKIAEAIGSGNPQGKPATVARLGILIANPTKFIPLKTEDSMSHDWTPLLWILALAAIAALAWYIWWRFIRGQWLVNWGHFWANRRFIGSRRARVRIVPGSRQTCAKQVRNVSAGGRIFQDQSDANEDDTLEFRLENHNGSHAPIPASGVWVGDDLPEGLDFQPGTGRAYINRRYTDRADGTREDHSVTIPDAILGQLINDGRVLRMNQIAGMPERLPARSAFFVVFRTTVGGEEEEDEEIEFVVAPPNSEVIAIADAAIAEAAAAEAQAHEPAMPVVPEGTTAEPDGGPTPEERVRRIMSQ